MLFTYIIGSLALIVKPGPDLMCTLATALAHGKARAATLMTGLIVGCWLWVLVLAAGVASVFTEHPAVMIAIQCVGTGYIAYLAVCAFIEARATFKSHADTVVGNADARGWRLVGRGIFMSMSNPLTILFFLAFLPNFTRESSALPPACQVLLLGTLFCALVPFIYLPVIFAADFFRV
ncbi:MAG: LysE family translocator, partial [Kiritimatiellae bacterium]|nr:LysE family translocator [Kiritimatiellia bacterium]